MANKGYYKNEGPLPEKFDPVASRALLESHKADMVKTLLRLAEESEGWSSSGVTKGVLVEKKDTDTFPVSRGTYNFGDRFGPFDVVEYLRYKGLDWDPLMLDFKGLIEFDYFLAISYLAFKGMMMYEGRDFKNLAWLQVVSPDCVVQVCKGWEAWPDPSPLPKKNLVRGNLVICGHVMKRLGDGTLQVTSVIQPDMKVNVPKAFYKAAPFMTDAHVNMVKMKELMYSKGLTPHPLRPTQMLKELCVDGITSAVGNMKIGAKSTPEAQADDVAVAQN